MPDTFARLDRLEFLFLMATDVSKADLDRESADQEEPFRLVLHQPFAKKISYQP